MEVPDSPTSHTERVENTSTTTTMDSKDLIDAVRKQIEYYFSKENLQQDAYLNSQMDANMSVPISVVMKFKKLEALTQDESIVRKSLENATVTIIDDRIRANVKGGNRSTIILREMPSATEEEVREIFNFEGCKPIISMRSDIEDTWFVIMDSEEDAKDTLLDLRLKKRTFRGQSVKARLKSETMVRSFYAVKPPVAPVQMIPGAFPGFQYPQFPGAPLSPDDIRAYGFGILPGTVNANNAVNDMLEIQRIGSNDLNAHMNGMELTPKNRDRNNRSNNAQVGMNAKAGSNPGSASRDGQNRAKGGATSNGKGKDNSNMKKGKSHNGDHRPNENQNSPTIEINGANFPPLHHQFDDNTPVPTPNYKGPFQKYSFDEIIGIAQNINEAALPSTVQPEEHPLAMTTTPHADLLLRQRTFSIDETREQLTQGRPVQRTAIINGAVDYRSMMLGDGDGDGEDHTAYEEAPKKTTNGSWAARVMSNTGTVETSSPSNPARVSTAKSPSSSTTDKDGKKKEDSKSQDKSGNKGNNNGSGDKDKKKDNSSSSSSGGRDKDKKKDSNRNNGKKDGNKDDNTNKKDSNNGNRSNKKGNKNDDDNNDSKEESQQQSSSSSISSWGGKPTFASIIKQQQTAAEASSSSSR